MKKDIDEDSSNTVKNESNETPKQNNNLSFDIDSITEIIRNTMHDMINSDLELLKTQTKNEIKVSVYHSFQNVIDENETLKRRLDHVTKENHKLSVQLGDMKKGVQNIKSKYDEILSVNEKLQSQLDTVLQQQKDISVIGSSLGSILLSCSSDGINKLTSSKPSHIGNIVNNGQNDVSLLLPTNSTSDIDNSVSSIGKCKLSDKSSELTSKSTQNLSVDKQRNLQSSESKRDLQSSSKRCESLNTDRNTEIGKSPLLSSSVQPRPLQSRSLDYTYNIATANQFDILSESVDPEEKSVCSEQSDLHYIDPKDKRSDYVSDPYDYQKDISKIQVILGHNRQSVRTKTKKYHGEIPPRFRRKIENFKQNDPYSKNDGMQEKNSRYNKLSQNDKFSKRKYYRNDDYENDVNGDLNNSQSSSFRCRPYEYSPYNFQDCTIDKQLNIQWYNYLRYMQFCWYRYGMQFNQY